MTSSFFIKIHHEYDDYYVISAYRESLDIEEFIGVVPDDFVQDTVTTNAFSRLQDGEKVQFRMEEVTDGS